MSGQYNKIKVDRFQNPFQLVGCKPNKNGFPVGYVEIGGKTYKIEPSQAQKDGIAYWVKVTKINSKPRPTSM